MASDQAPMRRREMLVLSAGTLTTVVLYGCGDDEEEGKATTTVAEGSRPRPGCVLTPEQDEGPFYIDLAQVRRDVVEDRPGVPLALALTVVDAGSCEPIPDAAIDIWHCDALGAYSGEATAGTNGETYLRGIQLTDKDGRAEFATIYPGQYPGRTTHIHLKVRLGGRQGNGTYAGGRVSHVGQLFTTDRDDARVFAQAPYSQNQAPITAREADFIYREQGGSSSALALAPAGGSLADDGFKGSATLGIARG
jgi:protocatechuate 3,4-dioxygenase beta subunit